MRTWTWTLAVVVLLAACLGASSKPEVAYINDVAVKAQEDTGY